MKIDLSKVSFQPKWFDFPKGGKLKIQPLPFSRRQFEGKDLQPVRDAFRFCLVEWEGYEDKDGKPLPLTESVKDLIYDLQIEGIPEFVLGKSNEMLKAMQDDEKN